MKKIVSQVKGINTDFADMVSKRKSQRKPGASGKAVNGKGPQAAAPSPLEYSNHYVVDDWEARTVALKAAVHLGLLLDDVVEYASRLGPLAKWRKSQASSSMPAEHGVWHDDEPHYDVRYRQKIDIPAANGVTLCANLFAPAPRDPQQTFPAIVFINSWCADKHQYLLQARRFARNGYLVLSYSARGWGQSTGVVDVGGPNDMHDISSVIDWLIEHSPVQVENIGFSGISYGSGLSLLGAAHDKRIKTVVCMSGWTDLIEAFFSEQTPRKFFAKALVHSSKLAAKTDDSLDFMLNGLLTNQHIDQVLAWGRQRSPSTYLKALNQRKPPVYLVQNFQDELFHPNPVLDFFTRFKGPKRLDLNKGTHGSAELSGILGLNNHLWRQTHAWFDHWLKGDDNRVMEQAPITCQFARHRGLQLNLGTHEGDRQSLGDWQPTRANMTAYHLLPTATGSATGALAPAPGPLAAHNAIYSGPGISKTTAGIPLVSSSRSAHLNMPLKLNRARIRPKHTLVFESASFQQRMCILGTGQLTLHLECSRPQMQLVAYLYEVDADGHGRLVTHGPMTRHEVQTNTPMEITFELMTTCYEIEAGHHLLLAIDTSDMQYQRPTRDEFKVTFHYGGAHRAELAIPLVHAEDTGLKD